MAKKKKDSPSDQPSSKKTVAPNSPPIHRDTQVPDHATKPIGSISPATRVKSEEKAKGKEEEKDKHHVVEHGFRPDPQGKPQSEMKKLAFLDYYNDFQTPAHTCQALGIGMTTFYDWVKADASFRKAWQVVDRHLTDRLVRIAHARAFRGSDNLLMFLLKARDSRFKDKIQAELDPRLVDRIVNALVASMRKNIPNNCPHCKSDLALSTKVEEMLRNLSQGVKP